MKKLTTLLLLSFCVLTSAAQEDVYNHQNHSREISLRSRMIGNEVSIVASKSSPGFCSIYLEFDKSRSFSNVRDVFKVIEFSDSELIRFRYDSINGVPRFKYSHYTGAVNSKVKHDFTYRLPFGDGVEKKVWVTKYDNKPDSRNTDRVVYKFVSKTGDDVYAMRRGTVTRIEDATWYREGVANNITLRKANKLISIEHRDGSVAQYYSIQEGTVAVELGDLVYPDTVIGKAGTVNDETYNIMVSILYMTCPTNGIIPDFSKVEYRYVEPYFSTPAGTVQLKEDGNIACKADDALITAEMTKREKKNRNKR